MSDVDEMLTALANSEGSAVEPNTRIEQFLKACIDGDTSELPEPISEIEKLLAQVAEKIGGGDDGGGGDAESNPLENLADMSYYFYRDARDSFVPLLKTTNTSKVEKCDYMFYRFNIKKKAKNKAIPSFDMSSVTSAEHIFEESYLNEVGDLDFSKCKYVSNVFANCSIERVKSFKVSRDAYFNYTFSNGNVKHIIFKGEIGRDIELSYPVDEESLASLFETLVQLTDKQTVEIAKANKSQLTDEQIAIATEKGWTIA